MSALPVIDLASLLPFVPGQRAPLTLVDLPGQTRLVLAELDAGAEVPPHAVPYQAGVLVLSGALEVMRGDAWQPAAPGQYLPLPVGVRHALEPSHFLVVHARARTA